MEQERKRYFDVRIVIGLLIVAAGAVLLLDSLGIGIAIDVWDYWPVILIVIGLGKLLSPRDSRGIFWGIAITAVGVLFLLSNLGYIDFWFDDLWPIILILIGFEVLRGGFFRHRIAAGHPDSRDIDNEYIDVSVVLGGVEYNFVNKKLKGGRASAIMGGCEIDLRNAEMESDSMVLETSAVMGGIEIRVPDHWQVVMKGSPIMGAMEDKTRPSGEPVKRLIIKGSAIMGAVEVKS